MPIRNLRWASLANPSLVHSALETACAPTAAIAHCSPADPAEGEGGGRGGEGKGGIKVLKSAPSCLSYSKPCHRRLGHNPDNHIRNKNTVNTVENRAEKHSTRI